MYSNSSNGYERVTPVPQNWVYEDPIGDELAGRDQQSQGQSSRASRNKPVPLQYTPNNELHHHDNTPTNGYEDRIGDALNGHDYLVDRSSSSASTSPYPAPPLLRHGRDKSVNNSVQSDVTVKKVVIDLEINIKINVR